MCIIKSLEEDSTLINTNEEIEEEPHIEIQQELPQEITMLSTIEPDNFSLIREVVDDMSNM